MRRSTDTEDIKDESGGPPGSHGKLALSPPAFLATSPLRQLPTEIRLEILTIALKEDDLLPPLSGSQYGCRFDLHELDFDI